MRKISQAAQRMLKVLAGRKSNPERTLFFGTALREFRREELMLIADFALGEHWRLVNGRIGGDAFVETPCAKDPVFPDRTI